MGQYHMILFDLDGTLTDSKMGIIKSIQYALKKVGIEEPDTDKLTTFIGPPLLVSLQRYYGMTIDEAQRTMGFYWKYFGERGIYEYLVYQGVPELLYNLKRNNKILMVATSKKTVYAEQVIRYFQLDSYFDLVIGDNSDGTRADKTEIIATILRDRFEIERKECIMIGDREHDVIGARNNGIDSAAVTFGYGSLVELQQANPTYLVYSIPELAHIFF